MQTVDEFGREGATALMRARGLVDLLMPRGSAGLIRTVVEESTVPVIETGAGVVHVFLDESADVEMATSIILNSKTQRVAVCNAAETLLVHSAAAERLLPPVLAALRDAGVTLHADERTRAIVPGLVPATDDDWAAEYYSMDLAVAVVDDIDAAMDAHRRLVDAPHRVDRHRVGAQRRAVPRRGRLRGRHGERLHPLHRRRRVRLRRRGRHLDAEAARPRPDGLGS